MSEIFKVGDIIEVTVANFAYFGVFCKCPNNYKGLIHVSNITTSFVSNVEDYFSINDIIKVEIISIDNTNKKLSLSTKNLNIEKKGEKYHEKVTNYNNSLYISRNKCK